METLQFLHFYNRAHFTSLWLETGLGQEEIAASLCNLFIHTEFFMLNPKRMYVG